MSFFFIFFFKKNDEFSTLSSDFRKESCEFNSSPGVSSEKKNLVTLFGEGTPPSSPPIFDRWETDYLYNCAKDELLQFCVAIECIVNPNPIHRDNGEEP